jgi:histidinol-phosphate/aromatic aminotransferase/cobyric acid decarboxylase-like protein
MRYQHGGNLDELARQAGCRADEILDFSANLNPLGPPAWLRQELSRNVAGLAHYPPPHAEPLIDAIAQRYGLPRETLVAGNGSSELLFALPRASGCRRAVIPVPAYGDYLTAARQARLEVVTPRLSATTGFRLQPEELARILCSGDLVILGRPANPTATLPDAGALRDLARAHPDCLFLVDEAFVDFLAAEDTLLHDRPENVVVLRSMTKFFAVPGLRLGFVALASQLAAVLRDQLPAWSVNTLAQAVGVRALADAEYAAETR